VIHDRFDAERNVLFVSFEGLISDEDLVKYAQRIATSPAIPPGHGELVDLRRVEVGEVHSHTLRRIAELFAGADRTPERSRVAIVASDDVAYGLSRMYQAFRSESPLDLRVFRAMNEARAWLGLEPE
jgi:hypothetical protein